jgi:hypothetical protein
MIYNRKRPSSEANIEKRNECDIATNQRRINICHSRIATKVLTNTCPQGGGCDDANIATKKAQLANFIFLVGRNAEPT